jgi:6,7-dimethyl-8-ribityllumazine synthase
LNKILLIEARFYTDIADQLAVGAIHVLKNNKMELTRIEVPGVFEIPAAAKILWNTGNFVGVIALGCVIRGATDHYEHICREVSRAVMDLSVLDGIPIGFGILTCENHKQALERANIKKRDIGGRAATACLHMINIQNELK